VSRGRHNGRRMTPLRVKFIWVLVVRGRSKYTQEAYTMYVRDLARYYAVRQSDLLRGNSGAHPNSASSSFPFELAALFRASSGRDRSLKPRAFVHRNDESAVKLNRPFFV
jgi:hypothetical protein